MFIIHYNSLEFFIIIMALSQTHLCYLWYSVFYYYQIIKFQHTFNTTLNTSHSVISNPFFLYKAPSLIWTLSDQLLFSSFRKCLNYLSSRCFKFVMSIIGLWVCLEFSFLFFSFSFLSFSFSVVGP